MTLLIDFQGQAYVIQSIECEFAFAGTRGYRKRDGFTLLQQLFMQIETSYVERQLSPQHSEKTQNVIIGLGESIGDRVDSSFSQLTSAFAPLSSRG